MVRRTYITMKVGLLHDLIVNSANALELAV